MGESAESGFQCNICGTQNDSVPGAWDREVPSCKGCGSTIRTRSLMQVLSEELFGTTLPVCDFPRLKCIRGVGMSDSADYAGLLTEKFDYRNTWYHRDPRLDITTVPESEWGQYDFVLSSEVMEHVPPPVEPAFRNLYRLLKPGGVLIMSVPFLNSDQTAEHFPHLHDFTIAALSDRLVLVNRTQDGRIEVHEDLLFHGGPGSTLELRLFSDRHLRELLLQGGFNDVQFYPGPSRQWGIVHPGEWSLPLAARSGRFSLKRACTAEWSEQWHASLERIRRQQNEIARLQTAAEHAVQLDSELIERTQWAQRLDAELVSANVRVRELEAELDARTGWARDLEHQVTERTQWALSLQAEVEAAGRVHSHAEAMREQLEKTRAELESLRRSVIVRVGRKLGWT